jgi:hypothetical protein
MRHARPAGFAAGTATAQARHLRVHVSLIDEDEPLQFQFRRCQEQILTDAGHAFSNQWQRQDTNNPADQLRLDSSAGHIETR